MKTLNRVLIFGGGPAGACYAALLASSAKEIHIYEIRTEKECTEAQGRSVNLAFGKKGWQMAKLLGHETQLRNLAVPMHGRLIHDRFTKETTSQAYGRMGQTLDSINRSHLNKFLIDLAKQESNVTFNFGVGCKEVLTESDQLVLTDGAILNLADYSLVIAADGVGSPTRESLKLQGKIEGERTRLNYAYSEIEFPAKDEEYSMPKQHLHIWPKGSCMVIALPNPDQTFTGGVFAPLTGEGSFEEINKIGPEKFFKEQFPSVLPLVPNFVKQFTDRAATKLTRLSEVRCKSWHYKNIVLVGDAAHAVTPFFGQGLNFGMFACTQFCQYLLMHPLQEAIAMYEELIPDANLLADWSLENFNDMANTDNPKLQMRKEIEVALEHERSTFNSHHSMVCFTDMSYCDINEELKRQNAAFEEIFEIEDSRKNWRNGTTWKKITNLMMV